MKERLSFISSRVRPYHWLLALSILIGLYLTSMYSYLLFHTFIELFSIIVAGLIFSITWNTRDNIENNYLILLGIAYFFIGGIDLIHTLAYEGMGVFPGWGANLPTQLWISARYMEAVSLLAAPLFFYKDRIKVSYTLLAYIVGFSLVMLSVFGGFFPDCYFEGVGLTLFKKVSEYLISVILVFSLYFLYRYRDRFKSNVFYLLAVSIVLTIFAELAFTFYVSVYGFSNLIGHFFKLVSFYLVYRALIVTGLKEPFSLLYREVEEKEKKIEEERDRFQTYLDLAGSIIVALDREGDVTLINRRGCEILGCSKSEVIGKNWFDNFVPMGERQELKRVHDELISGEREREEPMEYENSIRTKGGEVKTVLWHNTFMRNNSGDIESTLSSGIDITDRRESEKELRRSEERKDFLNTLLRQDLGSKFQTIQGYLQLIEGDANLSEEHQKYLRKAIKIGKEQDEILGLAKKLKEIEETEWIREKDIIKVLNQVIEDISSFVEREGVELEGEYPKEVIKVKGNYSLNLIFSQIIFTRIQKSNCNKIKIDVKEKNDCVMVRIGDDGDPLPANINNMFKGESYTGETTGVGGVRYYIIKEIALHNGAKIEVKDSEMSGSRFDICLKKA